MKTQVLELGQEKDINKLKNTLFEGDCLEIMKNIPDGVGVFKFFYLKN